MSDHTNIDRLRPAYQSWQDSRGGSVDTWMALLDDNIQFGSLAQSAPQMAFAGCCDNRAALKSYFDGLLTEWEMLHFSMNQFFADGDAVVVRGSVAWRNRRTGKEVETPKIDFWRFHDGKAVEYYEYFDTARAFAAATPDS
jgi:uncharacterized protein